MGAIFCHVRRISPVLIEMPWVTSGSHEWNGASPSFMAREIKVKVMMYLFVWGCIVHIPSCL